MNSIMKILKYILLILVFIFLGWLAITFKINIGGLISKILGKKKNPIKPIISEGEVVGESIPIKENNNPFRDNTILVLEDGTEIQLPDGMKDTDVQSVIQVKPEVYNVKKKHEILTDIFDTNSSV